MLEVTAFNWTYWAKVIFFSIIFFLPTLALVKVVTGLYNEFTLKKVFYVFLSVFFITGLISYVRMPYLIREFDANKLLVSGQLCGFVGAREWYSLCIDGRHFKSAGTSRNDLSDAIFNFGWIEKPTGCIEIEYLNKGEEVGYRGEPPYTSVIIGRLREIPCEEKQVPIKNKKRSGNGVIKLQQIRHPLL